MDKTKLKIKAESKKNKKNHLLKMTEELYIRHFPQNKDVDYRKLMMSEVSLYSMDDPKFIEEVAKIIKSYFHGNKRITITDGTAHVGGASLNFASYFNKVNSVEIDKFHCNILKNNINIYKLNKKIDVYCDDYLNIMTKLNQDVIFFDPPWGGNRYKKNILMDLYMSKSNLINIINKLINHNKTKKDKTSLIVFKVPRNYNINKFLLSLEIEKITIIKMYQHNTKHVLCNMIILEL